VDGLWATNSEGVRLIVRSIISKISNQCGPEQWRRQKNFTAGAQPGHYNL